jgi:hypothetical protein
MPFDRSPVKSHHLSLLFPCPEGIVPIANTEKQTLGAQKKQKSALTLFQIISQMDQSH